MKYNQYFFCLIMLFAFNPSNAQVAFGFPDLAPPSTVIGTQATHDDERWDDFQDYANHPLYGILGKSVGQLAIYYSGSPHPYVCTGTLISERYVITNYHCVYPSKEYQGRDVSIANIRMYMNYHRPNTGRDAAEVKDFALFSQPVEYSADFDYAILEVAGNSPASEFGYVPVRFGDYSSSDSLFIIHHSADPSFGNSMSDHKRITFRDCQTLNFSDIGTTPVSMPDGKSQRAAVEGRDVPHFCDTTGGSSGSLVFNANGDIVGLHFAGLRNKDAPENSRFNLFINIRAILSQSHKLREIGYVAEPTPARPTPPAPTPPAPTPPAPTPPAPTVQRGYISISSSPSGATVALDGRVIGSTPLQNYAYDAGDYQLSLRYNGYQTYSESIRISANSLFQRSINLQAVAPVTAQTTLSDLTSRDDWECHQTFVGEIRYGSSHVFGNDYINNNTWEKKAVIGRAYVFDDNGEIINPIKFTWTLKDPWIFLEKSQTAWIRSKSYTLDWKPIERRVGNITEIYVLQVSSYIDSVDAWRASPIHNTCKYYEITWCGDGVIDSAYEICDPNNPNTPNCNDVCTGQQ